MFMKCPHCGSEYTELRRTYEDLDAKTSEYRCTACGKRFTQAEKKPVPQGELVMEIVDRGGVIRGEHEHIVRLYLTKEGTLTIKQKSSELDRNLCVTGYKFLTIGHKPRFKVKQNSRYAAIEYDSFRTLNDRSGTLFSVHGLTLFGPFLEKAKGNSAMQIVLRSGFLEKSCENAALINDAVYFLNNLIAPYPVTAVAPAQDSTTGNASSGGCYVATCVYGSYDCPEVWTLRRYRDDTLGATWYGRVFIRAYYAISPTLVKWFGKTKWFKKLFKRRLDRMVQKLNQNGVDNTPYQDKAW